MRQLIDYNYNYVKYILEALTEAFHLKILLRIKKG